MPFIPFGDDAGHLSLADRDLLWATMAYPRSEVARHELMARLKLQTAALLETSALNDAGDDPKARLATVMGLGATLGTWLEPHGGLLALANARSAKEVFDDWQARIWPGSVAGDILCYMHQMEVSDIKPSVNKAVAITVEYLKDATTGEGQTGPCSERYIRSSWEEFKPVAHFWLAFRVWQFDNGGAGDQRSGPKWFSPLNVETLQSFLALAEFLAKDVSFPPQGKRKPPIDPADFWRVPQGIALPAKVSLMRPGLEPWALKILKRYRRKV